MSEGGKELDVDWEWFAGLFPEQHRLDIAEEISRLCQKFPSINAGFFCSLGNYHKWHAMPDDLKGPYLYPSNAAVLDFAENFIYRSETILSYGCGFGVAEMHLARLGYNVVGYDDWSQLPRAAAEEFGERFPSSFRLLKHWSDVEPAVVFTSGIACWEPEVYQRPSVTWLLADSHYIRDLFPSGTPDGFMPRVTYTNMLRVYGRKR